MNPLVQGLFGQFKSSEELSALPDDDAFELFSASLVLRDDLLQSQEITDLLLDQGTTGIDVLVLEINGQVVWDLIDVADICDAAAKLDVTVHIIQAKQSSSIDSAQILNFGNSITRFLKHEPLSEYPRLEQLAHALTQVFERYAAKLRASPTISAHFVTTAPASAKSDNVVQARVHDVTKNLEQLGFVSDPTVEIWCADDLHSAWARKHNANEVEVQLEKQVNLPKMPGIDQAILGVVSVEELLKMVQNDSGMLDERVFYDNVRGFKGSDNPVNDQILETMRTPERSLLPVLNNGVTVVARSYAPKPGDAVSISDFQIVNGCQTSHCLYLVKEDLGEAIDEVYVPIRIVVTADEDVATKIIRATNSQTAVQENDLVALSRFQKKLEDYFRLDSLEVKLTYERRSGQFFDQEVVKTRVVTIGDQMRAISAVALRSPHSAARYANRLYAEVGESIFREDHKLDPYVAAAFAAYRLETAFRTGLDSVYKPARYHILMAYVYHVLEGPFAGLESAKSVKQSKSLITALKRSDQVSHFRDAAGVVVQAAGGELPSRDRLKRQQFTQELITHLLRSWSRV